MNNKNSTPSWREYSFSDIAKKDKFAIVDRPFGTQLHSDEYTKMGVPVVRIENLSFSGKFSSENLVFISKKKANQLKRSQVVPGDLIIAKTGATIGKSGMFLGSFNNGIIASSCMKVSCDPNKVDPKFIHHLIIWENGQRKILEGAGGSTRTSINIGPFSDIKFLIPESKSEQRKIAEILTTVDDTIERTEALIRKYQRIKQGLMQDLLTRGIDENGNIRTIESHTFIECRYGRIPRSWQISTLERITEKIADRDHRTPQYVDEGILIVSPKDFDELDNINFETCNHIPLSEQLLNKKKTDLRPNDIVFTRIGAGLGKACLVTEDMSEFSIVHSMAQIRPNNKIVQPDFLLYSLRSINLQKQIMDGIQSIGVPDLGLEKIKQLEILLPPIKEQKRISSILASNDNIVKGLYSELKKIYKLKQGLMQDLLTGKVRVTALLKN